MPIDLDFDRKHLWHPYTSLANPLPTYPVVAAQGAELILEDGRRLVDGMASWWCAIHGYGHPHLRQAVQTQLEQMSHVMFGGLTHGPAVALGKRLVAMTPAGLERVFLADSGSIAVEVALKMAMQFWAAQGERRPRFLTIRGGYHGDTFGAMSVCDPEGGMHALWQGFLPEQIFAPRPPAGFDVPLQSAWVEALDKLMTIHRDHLAALIVEPIVQGAGGMFFYAPAYLRAMRERCDAHGLPLIFDEIATGFGRSGALFAADHAGVSPDILCLGKALTGGTMTLAATLCNDRIAAGIAADGAGVLMHGPTFMGNPLACAAACASLELLEATPWRERVAAIEAQLRQELEPARRSAKVADVRALGAIGVIEMREPVDVAAVQRDFVDQGVWIRPFGKLVYIMPPYVLTPDQLSRLTTAMLRCASA